MINVRILNKSQISSTVCSKWQNTACREMGVLGQFLVGWRRESFPRTGHNFHFSIPSNSKASTKSTDKKECRTTANTMRTHWNLRSATVKLSKWIVIFWERLKKLKPALFFPSSGKLCSLFLLPKILNYGLWLTWEIWWSRAEDRRRRWWLEFSR